MELKYEGFINKYVKSASPRLKRYKSTFLVVSRGGVILVKTISPKEIYRYKVLRLNEGASPATLNRELVLLSKAFNVAAREWEWINENPVSRVSKEREDNARDRWLIFEEEERLLNACSGWLRDIVLMALHTGMRQGEVLSLRWPQVDLFRRTVLVRDTKNKTPRTIPLNDTIYSIIKNRGKVRSILSDLLFPNEASEKIDPSNLRRAFKAVLKKTGITDFRFHDLRHTTATRLAHAGADIYAIAKLLGHKDMRMTQRYAHHSVESFKGLVLKLEKNDCNLTVVDDVERPEQTIIN